MPSEVSLVLSVNGAVLRRKSIPDPFSTATAVMEQRKEFHPKKKLVFMKLEEMVLPDTGRFLILGDEKVIISRKQS